MTGVLRTITGNTSSKHRATDGAAAPAIRAGNRWWRAFAGFFTPVPRLSPSARPCWRVSPPTFI